MEPIHKYIPRDGHSCGWYCAKCGELVSNCYEAEVLAFTPKDERGDFGKCKCGEPIEWDFSEYDD